jgi:iron complex outermembrane receptor protein
LKKAFLLLAICLPFSLWAQSNSDSTSVSAEIILGEIVISSDLFESKKKDFAGSVTGIQPKTIDQSNSLYLQPILNSVPGVYMQSGALNTNRITIRGIGSRSPFATNKIKAYLDEIPLSTGEGETTMEDIDFSTLGGIEVYRGPASTMYGAGLGGAIHMVTRKTVTEPLASLDYSIGSFGLTKKNLALQLGGERGGLSIFYQDVDSDGYRSNNEYDRQSISAIGKVSNLGKKSCLTTYGNFTKLVAFIPSSLSEDDYLNSPTKAAFPWAEAKGFEDNKRIRLGLSLKTIYNEDLESTVAIFTNHGESREVTPFGNEDITTSNLGLRGTVRMHLIPEDKFNLVLGTEIFREGFRIKSFENVNSQNGTLESDLDQTRNYANVFVASEYQPSKDWVLSLGGNFNFSNYENMDKLVSGSSGATGKQNFNTILSPKFSVTRHLSENISLYALVAHGFSLPTFDETLNPNGDINEDIKPEKGFNYEIGLKGTLADNKVYFELTGYTMRINDLLVARRNSELDYSGFNAGNSSHNGMELLLNHQLLKTNGIEVNQSFAYTIMNYTFDDFIDDDRGDFSGNDLTGVPSYTSNYSLNIETLIGFYSGLVWQGVGKMPILDDNSIYSEAYNLVNIKFGFQKDVGRLNLNLYMGINNLLDEKYASMLQINPRFNQRYYYPGLPVNYFGGVKLGYRI